MRINSRKIITKTGVFGFVGLVLVHTGAVLGNEIQDCDPMPDGAIRTSLKDPQKSRFVTTEGQKFQIVLPDEAETVTVKEEERKLRVAEELIAIFGAIKPDKLLAKGKCLVYTQRKKRSTIEVTAKSAKDEELATHKFVTGPEENWYLSADLPVTNITQLSYDSGSSQVVEKEKPASFYIGLNYKTGDVYDDYHEKDKYKNITFKLLFKASSRPTESMGIGIGYAFRTVEVFAARIRTQDDDHSRDLGNSYSNVYGISLDISKGVSWLK